jgi:hypothetical protein
MNVKKVKKMILEQNPIAFKTKDLFLLFFDGSVVYKAFLENSDDVYFVVPLKDYSKNKSLFTKDLSSKYLINYLLKVKDHVTV